LGWPPVFDPLGRPAAGLDFSVDRGKPHRLGFAVVSISAGVGFTPAFAFRFASAKDK
jgi:hypothetical protein